MGGLGSQNKRKGQRAAVDMSMLEDELETAAGFRRPPKNLCDEHKYTTDFAGNPQTELQLKIRMLTDVASGLLVEFCMILQAKRNGRWSTVVEIDTSHGDECHYHQFAGRLGRRLGSPTTLMPVTCMDDVQSAYDYAYEHLLAHWSDHVERWRNG